MFKTILQNIYTS